MSARRGATKYVLPPNPEWVEFDFSDGDKDKWPTNTERKIEDGEVNYHEYADLEHGTNQRWRKETANNLAGILGWDESKNWVFKDFPKNYRMFIHKKGPASSPREDVYLFGFKSKYRSVNEFTPHARWLLVEREQNGKCSCKHCSGLKQKDISKSLSILPNRNSGSPAPTQLKVKQSRSSSSLKQSQRASGSKGNREVTERRKMPYAAVQRAPKPVPPTPNKKELPSPPKHNVAVNLVRDVQSAAQPITSTTQHKRWYRDQELLWVHLNPPIVNAAGVAIKYWPGMVIEYKMKAETVKKPNAQSNGDVTMNGTGDEERPKEGEEWDVRQHTVYKMRLLAVEREFIARGEQLLPYQAYGPSPDLRDAIQAYPWAEGQLNPEQLNAFDPCLAHDPALLSEEEKGRRFQQAVLPYAFAVQIASRLSAYWALTDEWEFTHSGVSKPGGSILNMANGYDNGQTAALEAPSSLSSGPSGYHSISGPSNHLSQAEIKPIAAPPPIPKIQLRYQGVWWGPERIWSNELVRLKLARNQLSPDGYPDKKGEIIYPQSGPSKDTLAFEKKTFSDAADASELGAGPRGLFMKIDAFYIVDIVDDDTGKAKKECRACGMVYELADEGWEDPTQQPVAGQTTPSKQPNAAGTPSAGPPSTPAPRAPYEPVTNSQLSSLTGFPAFPLPSAPNGFFFRPILSPGMELVVSLTMISGRYYPQILSHPLLHEMIAEKARLPPEEGGIAEGAYLWALEGLSPGFHNSVEPTKFTQSRSSMLKHSNRHAVEDVEGCIKAQRGDEPMEDEAMEDEPTSTKT